MIYSCYGHEYFFSCNGRKLSMLDSSQLPSRKCLQGQGIYVLAGKEESLNIGSKVSSALVDIVTRIKTRPRYLLAKVLIRNLSVELRFQMLILLVLR